MIAQTLRSINIHNLYMHKLNLTWYFIQFHSYLILLIYVRCVGYSYYSLVTISVRQVQIMTIKILVNYAEIMRTPKVITFLLNKHAVYLHT